MAPSQRKLRGRMPEMGPQARAAADGQRLTRCRPGQRLRSKVVDRDGTPVALLEVDGKATEIEALRRAARQARLERWAQTGGRLDLLCGIAATRPGDRLIVHSWRRGRANRWLVVHRLRRGALRFLAVVRSSYLYGLTRSLDLVQRYAPALILKRPKAPHVRLQMPGVGRNGRMPRGLRLAPGSLVRLPCPPPANEMPPYPRGSRPRP